MNNPVRVDLQAAQTWDRGESLDETSARIHDGCTGEEALMVRARYYVRDLLFGQFPQAEPGANADILEIGSGVGWLMQAMADYLGAQDAMPRKIIGLDIAHNMLDKARQRLGSAAPYEFLLYDGITVPLPDASLDLIYSGAALQHIPRPYVFNLFFEIHRLLRPRGCAVLHFISTDYLAAQEPHHGWRQEIRNQITGAEAHWHHYYTAKELQDVLRISGFADVAIADSGRGTLVAYCRGISAGALNADWLDRFRFWKKNAIRAVAISLARSQRRSRW